MADELWAIVRAYNRLVFLTDEFPLSKRFLRDLNKVLGFTCQSDMVSDDGTIKHIYDAHDEEKSVLSIDPAILDIGFPELIGACDDSIVSKYSGMLFV